MTMTDDERIQFAAYLGLDPSIYHERDSMTKVLLAMARKMQTIEQEQRRTSTVTAHLCMSCRYWNYAGDAYRNMGDCMAVQKQWADRLAYVSPGGVLWTNGGFGCRLWEAKGE